jgi:hypothetical protein
VFDLRAAEAGSVVLEGKGVLVFIVVKAAQAVSVGEEAKVAKLVVAERVLQFVSDLDKGHRLRIIAALASWAVCGGDSAI